jgi:hypothetical protein
MEETCRKLAGGRVTWVIIIKFQSQGEIPTLPVSLQKNIYLVTAISVWQAMVPGE